MALTHIRASVHQRKVENYNRDGHACAAQAAHERTIVGFAILCEGNRSAIEKGKNVQ